LDRDHFLLADLVVNEGLAFESIGLDISTVFGVQGALIAWLPGGSQDGEDGPSTQRGVRQFEQDNGLMSMGSSTDPTMLATLSSRLSEAGFTVLGV
jgi:peptidoglycan hydrolase-like protein with peptidoglycan-binding domain